jgi:hypothetical protein
LKGVFIENALAVTAAAESLGLILENNDERGLPANRRYLPPPTDSETSVLSKRMRTESILSFSKL